MKRLLFCFSLLLAVMLAGCGGSQSTTETAETMDENIKSQYQIIVEDVIPEEYKMYGYSCEIQPAAGNGIDILLHLDGPDLGTGNGCTNAAERITGSLMDKSIYSNISSIQFVFTISGVIMAEGEISEPQTITNRDSVKDKCEIIMINPAVTLTAAGNAS